MLRDEIPLNGDEKHADRDEKRNHRADQARAQLGQMLDQRRGAVFDLISRPSGGPVCLTHVLVS